MEGLNARLRLSLCSSVGIIQDMGTGCWFDPSLGQYSFQGVVMVIATGLIPLSQFIFSMIVIIWESSQWLGKNIVLVKQN